MEWYKLGNNEKYEFLRLNNIYSEGPRSNDRLAQELFEQLQETNANTFTQPVIDLYVATQLRSQLQTNQRYSQEQIQSADDTTVQQFAQIMRLPIPTTQEEMVRIKERIIRILDYIELIFPLTIGQLLSRIGESKFYYRFNVDEEVDIELTNDYMPRHKLDVFIGFDECTWIEKIGSTYFRVMQYDMYEEYSPEAPLEHLEVTISGISPDTMADTLPAIPENMNAVFENENIISNGKIRIPRTFEDYVVMEESDNYRFNTTVDVIFEFDHFEGDNRILDYIEFFDPS